MTHTPRTPIKLQHQTGAALALSLMMMAILTLLAVASMNSTLLEMLMAGNLQFQTRTLINVENTLTTAEQAAQTLLLPLPTTPPPGQSNMLQDGVQDPLAMTWDGSDSITADVAANRYMLEHVGTQTPPGNSNGWASGGAGTTQEVIRATARSEGTKGTVRMVQSIYVR